MKKFTHIDNEGNARMVDVSEKASSVRKATAEGFVAIKPETVQLILERNIPKGDVLATARIAGIMAAKKTWDIIPMCHPLDITSVTVELAVDEKMNRVNIKAMVKTIGRTGVEMEALTAVSVAALTIYDMCKAIDKEMIISGIALIEKCGGQSGGFKRKD